MAKVKNKIHDLFFCWFDFTLKYWKYCYIPTKMHMKFKLNTMNKIDLHYWFFMYICTSNPPASWDMLDLLILLGVATAPDPHSNSCSERWEYCLNWKFLIQFRSQKPQLCNPGTGWPPASRSCSLSSVPPWRRMIAFHVRESMLSNLPTA